MLNTVAMIASKLWQWQVLHANINATDDRAEPSPTVYMCNQSATRYLSNEFIKLNLAITEEEFYIHHVLNSIVMVLVLHTR